MTRYEPGAFVKTTARYFGRREKVSLESDFTTVLETNYYGKSQTTTLKNGKLLQRALGKLRGAS